VNEAPRFKSVRPCEGCGEAHLMKSRQRFHSPECHQASKPHGYRRKCRQCGDWFNAARAGGKFCSQPCAKASRRRFVERPCKHCGVTFQQKPWTKRLFCSRVCCGRWRKLHPSAETRAKQSEAQVRRRAYRKPLELTELQQKLTRRGKDQSSILDAYRMGRRDRGTSSWNAGKRVGVAIGYEMAIADMRAEYGEAFGRRRSA
jgi:hypothetical protein